MQQCSKASNIDKLAFFTKVQERKNVLFARVANPVMVRAKEDCWEAIRQELVAEGNIEFTSRTWKHLRDVSWATSKTRTLAKLEKSRAGQNLVFTEAEKLLLEIVNPESPLSVDAEPNASNTEELGDEVANSVGIEPAYNVINGGDALIYWRTSPPTICDNNNGQTTVTNAYTNCGFEQKFVPNHELVTVNVSPKFSGINSTVATKPLPQVLPTFVNAPTIPTRKRKNSAIGFNRHCNSVESRNNMETPSPTTSLDEEIKIKTLRKLDLEIRSLELEVWEKERRLRILNCNCSDATDRVNAGQRLSSVRVDAESDANFMTEGNAPIGIETIMRIINGR